jgi:serine/threonine protein kinase/WD40 repeat protein
MLSPTFTTEGLIESLREHHLLDAPQLDEARQIASAFTEPRQLAHELTRRSLLTAFQVRMLAQGRGEQLVVGPYIILEKLGEGGMGAVFKAHNVRLGRIVAIKLLRKERSTNAEVIRRFHREVQVASSLAHPNVVRAFDASDVEGNLVFEMEYVEGINLTQLVHKRGALPAPMASDFIRQAALGLQHAHEKGLVHRDIKPSNLVVTRARGPSPPAEAKGGGEPSPYGLIKLLDLGLALIQSPDGGHDKTRLTQLGKVIGTTDFLAPEQARNSHGVDIRADLYALGCTLYYLLTAKVPFPEGAAMEKLLKHQLDEPEPIEKLRPEVPPGLIEVVRKLMAKKAQDRYQTPADVAAALEPYAQLPVKSTPQPPDLPPLPPKAPATHKVPTLPAAKMPSAPMIPVMPLGEARTVPAIPVVTASETGSEPVTPVTVPTAVAVLEPPALPAALAVALPAPAAAAETTPASESFLKIPAALPIRPPVGKRSFLWPALILLVAGGLLGAGAWIALRHRGSPPRDQSENRDPKPEEKMPPRREPAGLDALAADQIPSAERIAGQPKELVAVLGEHRQRHWAPVTCIACSPDGRLIATGGADGVVRLWNAATGKEESALCEQVGHVFAVAFLHENALVSVNQVGPAVQAMWWSLETMKCTGTSVLNSGARNVTVAAVFLNGEAPVVALAGRMADGTGTAWLSLLSTGEEHPLPQQKELVTHLAWAPDGKLLAAAGGKAITLWTVLGQQVGTLPGHEAGVTGLAFVKDGKVLVSTGVVNNQGAGEMKTWDMVTKALLKTVPLPAPATSLTSDDPGLTLAWGYASAQGGPRITVWDVDGQKERAALGPIDGPTTALAFVPKEAALISVGPDQGVHVWDLDKSTEQLTPRKYHGRVAALALSPDDKMLAYLAATPERSVIAWDVIAGKEKVLPRLKGKFAQAQGLGFVGAGKTLACWGPDGVAFWDVPTGNELPAFRPPDGAQLVGPIAPDGHGVVVVGKDLSVKLWDPLAARAGKERVAVKDAAKGVNGIAAFSPDGKLLALGGFGLPGVRLYDTVTGAQKAALKGLDTQAVALAFSPDGQHLAAVAGPGSVHAWDTATGKELCTAAGRAGMSHLVFSGDGAFLAVWGPRVLAVVDVAAKKVISETDTLGAVALAPTGQTIAVVKDVRTLSVLDLATGDQLRQFDLPGPVQALTFSADGRHVVTANGNGTFYVLRLKRSS